MHFDIGHKRRGRIARSLLALCLAGAGLAFANGEDYFEAALEPGPDPMHYVGFVKDPAGKPLKEAEVVVTFRKLGFRLETMTQPDGSYRSHDMVKAMKLVGENFSPLDVEIFAQRRGYHQVAPTVKTVPQQARGQVNMNFVLAPDDAK
jgi:hypothetical protein